MESRYAVRRGQGPAWHFLGGEKTMTDNAYPEALQEIIETFRDASQEERLDMLLEYAMNLPELPEELHNARDTMEQVHECQTPVFLLAKLLNDTVHYYLDVPLEAP